MMAQLRECGTGYRSQLLPSIDIAFPSNPAGPPTAVVVTTQPREARYCYLPMNASIGGI